MNHLKSNREHSFDIELATIVGLEKAILLKNIAYWCEENRRRDIRLVEDSEVYWTEESVRSLEAKYPYFRRATINRWMSELHNDGWIRRLGVLGGKNLYSPGPAFLTWDAGGDWKNAQIGVLSQNGTPPELSQNGTVVSQNGTPTVPKWDTMCPKMGHMYSNSVNNVELYVCNTRAKKTKVEPQKKEALGQDGEIGQEPKKNESGFKGARAAAQDYTRDPKPVLFVDSVWHSETDEAWRVAFSTKIDIENVDAKYYRQRVMLWSESQGKKSQNWVATAASFAQGDHQKGKLVTVKLNTHATLTNPVTGHTTTIDNLQRATGAAQRILASRKP